MGLFMGLKKHSLTIGFDPGVNENTRDVQWWWEELLRSRKESDFCFFDGFSIHAKKTAKSACHLHASFVLQVPGLPLNPSNNVL